MEEAEQAKRLTPLDLFLLFLLISVQSFGGTLPFARRELIERRRILTEGEFAEMLALGQVLPGPNVINMSAAIGDRNAGWPGAAAAVAGMVVVPVLIVMALATAIGTVTGFASVQGGLLGMAAAAAGLLLGTAWRMAKPMRTSWRGIAVFAGVFGAVALLRLPLVLVLACAIPASLALHGVFRRG